MSSFIGISVSVLSSALDSVVSVKRSPVRKPVSPISILVDASDEIRDGVFHCFLWIKLFPDVGKDFEILRLGRLPLGSPDLVPLFLNAQSHT